MFTGIIETTAQVIAAPGPAGGRLSVRPAKRWGDLVLGESVAVSGACLTVAAFDAASIAFDVIAQTARGTTLGSARPGDRINLERSLRAGDRFGGHYVLGHVDCVGTVRALRREGRDPALDLSFPATFGRFLVPKGSIAANGVSLTLARVQRDCFTVCLVPYTLAETNLGALRVGDGVNLEFDYFGKWALRAQGGELGEALDRAGFSEGEAWNG